MGRGEMRVEGGAVVVDFIEHDAGFVVFRSQHVEAPAAGLVAAGGPRIDIDQLTAEEDSAEAPEPTS